MVKHVVEGIAEFIRHLLNFKLFPVNLVLNIINPEVKEIIKGICMLLSESTNVFVISPNRRTFYFPELKNLNF